MDNVNSFEVKLFTSFDRALKLNENKKYKEAFHEYISCMTFILSFLENHHTLSNPKFSEDQLFKFFKMCLDRVESLRSKIPRDNFHKLFENQSSENRTDLFTSLRSAISPPPLMRMRPKSLPASPINENNNDNNSYLISHQMGNNNPTRVFPTAIGFGSASTSPSTKGRNRISWGSSMSSSFHTNERIRIHKKPGDLPITPISTAELLVYKRRFKSMDTSSDSRISKREFALGLGLLGLNEFSDLYFPCFGMKKLDSFDSHDFEKGLHCIFHGTKEERMRFSYPLFDPQGVGFVQEELFGAIFKRAFQLIEYMKGENIFDENNSKNTELTNKFVWSLFKRFGGDDRGIIVKDNLMKFVHQNRAFVRELGLNIELSNSRIRNFRNRIGNPTCFGDKHFNLVLQMMTGVSIVVDMFKSVEKFSIRDFSSNVTFNLPNAPWDKVTSAKFTAHCPLVFKRIRKMCNVCTEEEFRHSFGVEQVIGNLMMGNLTTLTSSVSAGKSGNYFFSTYNGVFICKTISLGELEHLKNTLQKYVDYLEEKSNSFLTKIIGLYTLYEYNFIVMNNVFQTNKKMDVVYDLKGSTFGRTNRGREGPKKDLDLYQTGDVIRLGVEMRQFVLGVLHADAEFLRKNNIIDYSLLVGIHRMKREDGLPGRDKVQKDSLLPLDEFNYVRDDGGIMSVDGNKIYYMGVIDHLIFYGFKKQAESVMKRFWYGKEEQISVVQPDQYSKRFLTFLEKVFV